MEKLLPLATATAIALSAFPWQSSRAAMSPYKWVLGITAVNICMVRYGYLTTEEAVDLLFDAAGNKGITTSQVGKIMESSTFKEQTDKAINQLGGCRQIVADITGKTRRSKRPVAGEIFKPNPSLYYGDKQDEKFTGLDTLIP